MFLGLDVAVALLALFLVGGQRGAVGFQLALVRNQFLFDFGDVFGERGDFAAKIRQTIIDFLQADHQLQVGEHS